MYQCIMCIEGLSFRTGKTKNVFFRTCTLTVFSMSVQCTVFSVAVLYFQWLYCIFSGCTVFSVAVLYFQWLYCIFSGCIVFSVAVLYLQWLYCIFSGCIVFSVAVLYFQWLYCIFSACTVAPIAWDVFHTQPRKSFPGQMYATWGMPDGAFVGVSMVAIIDTVLHHVTTVL